MTRQTDTKGTSRRLTSRRGFLALALGTAAVGTMAAGFAPGAEAAVAAPRQVSREVIQRVLVEEAVRNGAVPPALALAVARVESNFQAHVTSSAGARGVMQIMPATARGEFGVGADLLFDARVNVRLGVEFLERLYNQYGNRWDLALSHYNGGTLSRVAGQWVAHSYTREYVNNVMRFWNTYQRERWVMALVNDVRGGTQLASAEIPARNSAPIGDAPPADPRVQAQMAADYAYLEAPGTQRGWREYLEVADRYLDAAADANAGVAVDFSDIAVADPNWSYPLSEGGIAETVAQASANTASATSAVSSAPAAGGSDRFIYSGRFWRMALGAGKFN